MDTLGTTISARWPRLSPKTLRVGLTESQYPWIPTGEHEKAQIKQFQYDGLVKLAGNDEANQRLHREQFFLTKYLRKQQNHDDLLSSWNDGYVARYEEWLTQLRFLERKVFFKTEEGMVYFIHTRSINFGIGCAVRPEYGCPHCPIDFPKFDIKTYESHSDYERKLPKQLQLMIIELDIKKGDGKDRHFLDQREMKEKDSSDLVIQNAFARIQRDMDIIRQSAPDPVISTSVRNISDQVSTMHQYITLLRSEFRAQNEELKAMVHAQGEEIKTMIRSKDEVLGAELKAVFQTINELKRRVGSDSDDETIDLNHLTQVRYASSVDSADIEEAVQQHVNEVAIKKDIQLAEDELNELDDLLNEAIRQIDEENTPSQILSPQSPWSPRMKR